MEINKIEIKNNRIQEESDKLKIQFQQHKMGNYDKSGNSSKQVNEKLQEENKKLEKQIFELLQAFKKQLRLIDIYKRQKTHLIAGQIFSY